MVPIYLAISSILLFLIFPKSQDDSDLIRNELRLAEKYPDNTTIVHMDKNGNYKVVYGLKLPLMRPL
jgi:hypothetical protein